MITVEQARQRVAENYLLLARRDAVATRLFSQTKEIDFSIIGFHAQQCLEKCFKSVMSRHGIVFPRTHDLVELQRLLVAHGHTPPLGQEELANFTPYAVTMRYDTDEQKLLTPAQVDDAVARLLAWADDIINPL